MQGPSSLRRHRVTHSQKIDKQCGGKRGVSTEGLSRLRRIASALILGIVPLSASAPAAAAQNAAPEASRQNKATASPAQPNHEQTPTIKLNVQLVLVRTVVRDSHGSPVENLHKEDFRVLDNGKEQTIVQFEADATPEASKPAEDSAAMPAAAGIAVESPPSAAKSLNAAPRLLALYFDDFAMSPADVIYARAAADRYLARNLRPTDRAAIVTASGTIAVEFTAELTQLHAALLKLTPGARGQNHDCPDISDYQAEEIIDREGNYLPGPPQGSRNSAPAPIPPPATQLAMAEAIDRCHMPSMSPDDLLAFVRSSARAVLDRSRMLAQYSLEGLDRLVKYLSMLPGQRSIILVSSGFLSTGQQFRANAIIDRALHSQVTISAIDPRGLAVRVREADASQGYMPTQSNLVGEQHQMDSGREMLATAILQQVAEGTGGRYFHNSNNLDAAFRQAVSGSEPGYVLAFVPSNMKFDGSFHALKVTLRQRPRGSTVQARRGYFAPRQAPDPAAEAKQEIQDALRTRAELHGLPVALNTKISKSASGMQLLVWAHLDIRPLRFRKEGERSANDLTFVAAIYSREGKLVTGQEKRLELNLPDASLRQLIAAGIDVTFPFQLKPGSYLVREVVTDSEDHRLTALSREVDVP